MDAAVRFTHERWRGRFRAGRGIGATLTADEIADFDGDHAALLEANVPPSSSVRQRLDCYVLRPRTGC